MNTATIVFVFALLTNVKSFVITPVNYTTVIDNRVNPDDEEIVVTNPDELIPQEKFTFVFPGTKWCGPGSTAEHYDDLGTQTECDICCREHDNCPEYILPGETKYNLTNDAYYARLSCKCDIKFHNCLRRVNDQTANTIGALYFNVIGTHCYEKVHKAMGCKKYDGWNRSKCLEYIYDETSLPTYQWFDVPKY